MGLINPTDLGQTTGPEVLAYDGGPDWRFPIDDAATGDLRYTFGQAQFYCNTGVIVPVSRRHQSHHHFDGARSSPLSRQLATAPIWSPAEFTADGTRNHMSDGQGTDDSGIVMVEGQLRLSPVFQLLGSVGYEDMTVFGESSANIEDPTWYGGFRWQRDKDLRISA